MKKSYNIYGVVEDGAGEKTVLIPGDIIVGKSKVYYWTYIIVRIIDKELQTFDAIWTDGREVSWLSPVTLKGNILVKL